ncbi:MAG: NADH-quinone oxidoreductase subunit L, partial [Candidatus Acidiferrales bacterium]
VTALMTAFYMFRLVFLTFFGNSRFDPHVEHHIHEAPPTMSIPLWILAGLSCLGGFVGVPAVLGEWLGIPNFFERFLEPVFKPLTHLPAAQHSGALEVTLMLLSVGVAAAGIWLAYQFYLKKPEIPQRLARDFRGLYNLVYNKYYIDEVYDAVFVEGTVKGIPSPVGCKRMGREFARFDLKVIDGLGVDGSAWLTRFTSQLSIWWDTWIVDGSVNLLAAVVWTLNLPTRALQTGLVQRYALWMATGIVLLLLYYVQRYWHLFPAW